MPQPIKNFRVAVGLEATAGTEQTTLALLFDAAASVATITPTRPLRDEALVAQGMPGSGEVQTVASEVTISVPLYPSTSADSAIQVVDGVQVGALLECCGFSVGSVSSGALPYTVAAPGAGKSCTIKVFDSKMAYTLVGCMGTFSIKGDAGQRIMAEFKMMGRATSAGVGTASTITEPDRPLRLPPSAIDQTVELKELGDTGAPDGSDLFAAHALLGWSFELGAEVVRVNDNTASDGKALPSIVRYAPKLAMETVINAPASGDRPAAMETALGNAMYACAISMPSPSGNSSILLNVSPLQSMTAAASEADGLLGYNFDLAMVGAASTVPLQITFTATAA